MLRMARLVRQAQLDHLRADIRAFRERTRVEQVVVLWTANTERYSQVCCCARTIRRCSSVSIYQQQQHAACP